MDAKAAVGTVENTMAAFGSIEVLVKNAGTAIPKKFETPPSKNWIKSLT